MLIEFSVENYLSFKELVTFSMVAASHSQHIETHVFKKNGYDLLKSASIYGANASGKSNLYKAMAFARNFILSSSKEMQAKEKINIIPFLLNSETESKSSFFEFVFIKDHVKYRYGFKLDKNEVKEEWLFYSKKIKERNLFTRLGQEIEVSKEFIEGHYLNKKTRNNALFLSVVANFNGKIAESILEWFNDFKFIKGSNSAKLFTLDYLKDKKFKKKVLDILKVADLAIDDFVVQDKKHEVPKAIVDFLTKMSEEITQKDVPSEIVMSEVKTLHNKFDKNNKCIGFVEFDLDENESEGSQKLFSLLGPILKALNEGLLLFIDELEVNLHPLITKFIVKLFNSSVHNPKNSQLIFSTHDTNLLSNELFRRDQIWFTEKDKYGATDLYSLVEYNVRPDRIYSKDYLAGKYGAIPFIGNFDFDKIED